MINYHKGEKVKITVVGHELENNHYNELGDFLPKLDISFLGPHASFNHLKTSDFLIVDTSENFPETLESLQELNVIERTIVILCPHQSVEISKLLGIGVKDVFVKPTLSEELAAKLQGFNNLLRHPLFLNSRYGLSLKQQKIFELLKAKRSLGVTRTDVLTTVWPQQQVSEKSVDVHIYNLRRSLTPFNLKIEHQSNRWFLVG